MATGYLDNYYARLGVAHNATQEEIRSAYHAAARKFHPDINQDTKATEIFLQIQEAYETLSNPVRRAAYDEILPSDIRTPKNLLVNTIYSRESLTVMNQSQLLYVLLNIMASPELAEISTPRMPVNLSIVIDVSNSMAGPRLDAVKATAMNIVRMMRHEDILSVVIFNDRAEVIIPASREQNVSMLEARISIITAGGGTEIFKGLEAGFSEIAANLRPNYSNHLILITDGRTYGDEEDCLSLAQTAAIQGVTFHALGIGHEWNDEFLESISTITGGNCEFAQSPPAIKKFLQDKFGQIQNSFVNNINLKFKTSEGVSLRYAFRLSPDSAAIPLGETLLLGDLPKTRSLSVILEFLVENTPNQKEDFILLDGTLEMVMPSAAIPNISSRVTFARALEENPVPAPPPRILVEALSRLSLYRLQEMARKDLKAGNVSKATSRLKNLATQLLTSGETALAQTVMLELDQIRTNSSMSATSEKAIKYGTRALLLETIDEGTQP